MEELRKQLLPESKQARHCKHGGSCDISDGKLSRGPCGERTQKGHKRGPLLKENQDFNTGVLAEALFQLQLLKLEDRQDLPALHWCFTEGASARARCCSAKGGSPGLIPRSSFLPLARLPKASAQEWTGTAEFWLFHWLRHSYSLRLQQRDDFVWNSTLQYNQWNFPGL